MNVERVGIVNGNRVIEGDWYPGTLPENVQIDRTAYVGSSHSFVRYRSELALGLEIGRGASLCDGTCLDVGPSGLVRLGSYALVNGAHLICDAEIEIGDYALVAWDVVLMDTYRVPLDAGERAHYAVEGGPSSRARACPIRIGRNAWIGFAACILPGVDVGEGSIVAARSVVASDVPPYVIVGGNPARVIRALARGESERP